MFIKQDPMRRVLYALAPIFLWSIYLYGWRVVTLTAFVYLLGIIAEFVFEKGRNKKVSEAVLVTCGLYALSMPPGVPFWAAGVGILFGVIYGKEVFGGFGRNIYNPAITGRTFGYIAFPLMFQTTWMIPGNFGLNGGVNTFIRSNHLLEAVFMLVLTAILFWFLWKNVGKTKRILIGSAIAVGLTIAFYVTIAYAFPYVKGQRTILSDLDVVTMATPIEVYKGLAQQAHWTWNLNLGGASVGDLSQNNLWNLFLGLRVGAIGEGAIFLILLAGIYLVWTKTANWIPMVWTVVSAVFFCCLYYYLGNLGHRFPLLVIKESVAGQLNDLVGFLFSGSLLFGAVFMATDPVSAPKKPVAQFLYGWIIGGLTMTIRVFAGFPEGISFAILTANTFAPLLDEITPARKKKILAKPGVAKEGGAA